mmetsp:Transcript_32821/g.60590  ORF Transcript_32821/g.60590 Transcript_32821/m.60590 type:complete len:84 (+) Transcript_32821:41-292(+)
MIGSFEMDGISSWNAMGEFFTRRGSAILWCGAREQMSMANHLSHFIKFSVLTIYGTSARSFDIALKIGTSCLRFVDHFVLMVH